nr:putative RNA-directed DNA polymerase, eukaryota, reverse transcriptase zinc-binding domain protein [Tanacetum cinerariifolium]
MGDRSWNSFKSKEDLNQQISKSVFVTNFPDHIRARDLRMVCKEYGSIVDVYIPLKKSKSGKCFAFVRFIKVTNLERLIENLCTIWIGSFHLHANMVHFQREKKPTSSFQNNTKPLGIPRGHTPLVTNSGNNKSSFALILKEGSYKNLSPEHSIPALVLDDSCFKDRDFSLSLMVKVRDASAIPNLYIILLKEGFQSMKLRYHGGLWILIELDSLDSVEKFQNHVPKFLSEEECDFSEDGESDDFGKGRNFGDIEFDNSNSNAKSDVEKVSESSCMRETNSAQVKNPITIREDTSQSTDPFNIYDLLQKKKVVTPQPNESDPTYPLGFTPNKNHNDGENTVSPKDQVNSTPSINLHSCHNIAPSSQRNFSTPIYRGSILDVMDDLIKMESIDLFSIKALWGNLTFDHAVSSAIGNYGVILGDFNEVRTEQEIFGSIFNTQGANAFNNFISKSDLFDLSMGGYSYTWSHKSATKMSNLDRFLISKGLMVWFPHLSGLCLERHLSDHRPIIMFESSFDYGPTPFQNKTKINGFKSSIQNKLSEVEKSIDQGGGNEEVLNKRTSLIKELNDINSIDALDLSQKAKNRWSIEGDENSKYFHGILNSKRSQLSIQGILCYVDWTTDPPKVKAEFLNHFSNQFSKPLSPRIKIDSEFPTRLNSNQVEDLERTISQEEVKKAVWDCAIHDFFSSVKDFRPTRLIGSLYKIIANILATRLSLFMSDLISDVQTTFVSNRQILDGPFILNEFLSWCKHKKINIMIFKVDFKKAFDSIRWDYLNDVLKSFGFGIKWCSWISGCLDSSMGSVLVNGRPTPEFHFYKGLKQGDPLSPFLFILVMERLHISFSRVIAFGLFKGVNINNSLTLSHLFYADDAIFVGKWDINNIKTIVNVLNCFFLASGLKINLHKSKLTGIGVNKDEVDSVATLVACYTFYPPFHYLGVKVGASMNFFNGIEKSEIKMIEVTTDLIKSVVDRSSELCIDLLAAAKRKLENGENTLFGEDKWIGEVTLKTKYPRLFALEQHKSITVAAKMGQPSLDHSFRRLPRGGIEDEQYRDLRTTTSNVLPNMHDRWFWSLDSTGEFSVSSVRNYIDEFLLPKAVTPTRWIKLVPIKLNITAWRICLDKLSTRLNLSSRGLDIPTILCPLCNESVESTSHVLLFCHLACQLMAKVCRWWKLDYTP